MAEEGKGTRRSSSSRKTTSGAGKPTGKKAPAKRTTKAAASSTTSAAKKPGANKAAAKSPAKKPAAKRATKAASAKPAAAKKPAAKRAGAEGIAASKAAPETKPATTKGTKSTAAERLAEASARLKGTEGAAGSSAAGAAARQRAASRPPVNLQPIAPSGAGRREPTRGGDESSAGPRAEAESSESNGTSSRKQSKRKEMPPAHEITAPSIGPHTVIEYIPPEERLAGHDIPQTDAMGHDKRRQVVGGSYGPSLGKQATLYGIFVAVIAALVIGGIVLVNELDQPPDEYADAAPWQDSQQKPARIDFPRSGSRPAVPVD